MNIDLIINGTLGLTILKDGKEVTDQNEIAKINTDLTLGNKFINLRERTILNTEFKVEYTFDFEVLETTEYEFELNN